MRLRAARHVELVDGGATSLHLHAVLGDVGEGADAGVELLLVGAEQQAARPVARRLEFDEASAGAGEAVGARAVGEGHDAVGVADIEGVAHQRHAEGLVLALEEHVPLFRHAVAVLVAPQADAVGAHAHGGGAPHRADHGVVHDRPGRTVRLHGFGDQHVAVGQDLDPAAVIEAARERIDLEAGRRDRRLAGTPALGRRHLERRDGALRLGRRDRRRVAPGRFGRAAGQPSYLERRPADHGDPARDNVRKAQGPVSLTRASRFEKQNLILRNRAQRGVSKDGRQHD